MSFSYIDSYYLDFIKVPSKTSRPMTDNSSGLVILITLLNILVYKLEKLKEAQQTNRLPLSVRQLYRRFTLKDIQLATNSFQKELVIGKGGFGMVYKGIIDSGEKIVAIKRLKAMSKQGRKEFNTEIEMLSQFRHSHLVPLIGYCDEREEMILVYEYMPSGSLADHLHKRVKKGDTSLPPLSWEQRLKICIGAAHGLDYLHTGTSIENRVIHRDVKSSNILLDENLEARISDFGLSKLGPANQTFTYVSTHVKGTPGYYDPYYVSTHRLTRKSDVYAFGVVLFEVLCGRRAVDTSLDEEQTNLAEWAQHCFKEGLIDQIADPNIKRVISSDSLNLYVDIAIKCLCYQPKHRPTMAEVVVGLESALTLHRKSAQHPLVEIVPTKDVNCIIPEVKDTHQSQVYEYAGEGIISVSNGWNHKKQSSVRITFRKRISGLLSVTARVFSVANNNSKAINHEGFLPVHPSKRRELLNQEQVLQSSKLKSYTFNELSVATWNFCRRWITEGSFGVVFEGRVDDNTFVVKRLDHESAQGYQQWLAEINSLGNLCHPNIVRLIGYSLEKNRRLLVYDLMPQDSLQKHLRNKAEYIGSCSDDGSVVINSLFTDEKLKFDYHRPMKAIALDPDYARNSSRRYVAGGLAGQLYFNVKRWIGYHDQVLHSGEGPIHAVKWRTSLVAWANDVGVKVYDTSSDQRITFIERPRGTPRPELLLPHLVWQDDGLLVIGWGTSVKISLIKSNQNKSTNGTYKHIQMSSMNQVDIVASFQTSYYISGISSSIPSRQLLSRTLRTTGTEQCLI